VAAAIGEDWEKLYRFTLEKNYRFLSYGDGSLPFLNSIQEVQLNAMPIQQKAN
jgi:S-adenosylmethionine:tRNA-ribosyltransferase-isomerase (queuine synthetase)